MSGTPVTAEVRRGPSRASWWKIAVGLAAAVLVVAAGLAVVGYKALSVTAGPDKPKIDETNAAALCLDEDERLRQWRIEQHGNVLARADGAYGFKAIAAALRSADADRLRKEMTPDFTGKLLKEAREVRIKKPFAEVVRLEDSGKPGQPVDGKGFVDKLLEYRKPFPRPPEVKLSLMKLSPLVPDKLEGLWEGTCQLRMYQKLDPNEKAALPPREVVIYLKYQILRPTEERLKEGRWLRSCEITQSQVAHSPEFLLRDVTAARGIDPKKLQEPFFHDNWTQKLGGSSTGGVFLCDFNHDGYMDMLVTDVDRIALFKGGPGGQLEEVTLKCRLPQILVEHSRRGVAAAFVDLDGDGWEDLILGGEVYRNVYIPGEGNHF
ncbi:MAG TPA: VCBS repeat-containing protein, partial [Gemmataceae bacterium]|nr:VCBS repeat-containing protein [Gemmataceae bacterium]